ncbi:MAG TPA: FtsX-like permease family protein [Vicinamibacterales bacterium]|nr:FtsX-like permease family protein [Vicinamibacterales bacterium]
MSFELFVALRYLLARRQHASISRVSLFSTIGVAVGVLALVVALALMTGLQGELRTRILGSSAHIYVWKTAKIDDYKAEVERLRTIPGVIGAGPAVVGKALVSTDRADAFITLKGVDPLLESHVTDIETSMQQGKLSALVDSGEERPGILLGRDLALQLGVKAGDQVTLTTPSGTLSPMGMIPRIRTVRVAGVYSLGLYEFDSAYGFVSLEFAERLLGKDSPDLIQLRVDDIYAASAIAESIPQRLGPEYVTEDWSALNRSLFSALWLEKMAISITIGLIVMVGALNIISSLILLVRQKSRDIAILKTMGTSSRRVMGIFMMQGLIIGVIGTTIGGICGFALCWVLDRYEVIKLSMDVYQVSHVPFVLEWTDLAVVVVSTIAICFLATLYPSRQASALDPVQALRFE